MLNREFQEFVASFNAHGVEHLVGGGTAIPLGSLVLVLWHESGPCACVGSQSNSIATCAS